MCPLELRTLASKLGNKSRIELTWKSSQFKDFKSLRSCYRHSDFKKTTYISIANTHIFRAHQPSSIVSLYDLLSKHRNLEHKMQ